MSKTKQAGRASRKPASLLEQPLTLALLRRGQMLCSCGGSATDSLRDAAARSVWTTYEWQRKLYDLPAKLCLEAARRQWSEIAQTGRVMASAIR